MKILVCVAFVIFLLKFAFRSIDASELGLDDECLSCDRWGKCYTDENGEEKFYCTDCPKFRENFPSPFSSQK